VGGRVDRAGCRLAGTGAVDQSVIAGDVDQDVTMGSVAVQGEIVSVSAGL
jgi:hypothetical protein